MIYPILGMHKSGTSMLSGTLHENGIPMFVGEQPLDGKYPKYEDQRALNITKQVLGIDEHDTSHSVKVPKALPSELHTQIAIEFVRDRASHASDWGFKIPSTLLCWDSFWKPILETAVKDVVVPIGIFRSPFWVWHHYRKHQHQDHDLIFKAWTEYNSILLNIVERDNIVLLQYSDFALSGPDEILSDLIGKPITSTFELKQRHLQSGTVKEYRDNVPDEVEELYDDLLSAKQEKITA